MANYILMNIKTGLDDRFFNKLIRLFLFACVYILWKAKMVVLNCRK